MRKLIISGAVALLLPLAVPAIAGVEVPPACTPERPDVFDECQTTPEDACTDAVGASVKVQIGGSTAEDSNGDDGNYTGTCEGTHAIALVTFEKLPANQVRVTIDNRTCDDHGSLTALLAWPPTLASGFTNWGSTGSPGN